MISLQIFWFHMIFAGFINCLLANAMNNEKNVEQQMYLCICSNFRFNIKGPNFFEMIEKKPLFSLIKTRNEPSSHPHHPLAFPRLQDVFTQL